MAIKKVGVCGCGLMGSGIAQVSAMAGFDVTVLEAEQRFLDKGLRGSRSRWRSLPSVRWRRAASQRNRKRKSARG